MKALALLTLFAACTTDVPATPNFQTDVLPIVAARCIRCHGEHPLVGASTQLDNYTSLANIDRDFLAQRLTSHEAPARFDLEEHQLATLLRWIEVGRPRGTPRPGNRAPQLLINALGATSWEYTLRDPDRDLVVGTISVGTVVVGRLHDGRDTILAHPSIPAGSYPVTVELDDGGEVFTFPAGTTVIP